MKYSFVTVIHNLAKELKFRHKNIVDGAQAVWVKLHLKRFANNSCVMPLYLHIIIIIFHQSRKVDALKRLSESK
jgi:hypothetical protein